MILDDVIARIAAGQLGLKTVDGVEALAELAATPVHALPAAYVVQAAEDFIPEQEGSGLLVVRSEFDFDVAVIVGAAAARGKAKGELAQLVGLVIQQLLGWTPDGIEYRPIRPISARLLGIEGGRVSWVVRFRTSYRLRKQG
jgi:hypothetical protein